jgi:hypothetical protein
MVWRAAQCKKEVERLTQNSGLSCSLSTRRGSDYELALYGINVGLERDKCGSAINAWLTPPLHSTPLHTTLPKVCIALIHSCASWGSTTGISQPCSTFQVPQDAVHNTFENGRFFESATSYRIKTKIPDSSSSPPPPPLLPPPPISTQFFPSSKSVSPTSSNPCYRRADAIVNYSPSILSISTLASFMITPQI